VFERKRKKLPRTINIGSLGGTRLRLFLAAPCTSPIPKMGKKFHYSPLQQLPHRAPILRAAWRPQTRGHNAPPPFHFDQSCRATWARTSGATADAGARAELEDAGWQRISEPTAELGGGGGSRGRRQISGPARRSSGPAAELGASGDSWRPAVNLSGLAVDFDERGRHWNIRWGRRCGHC
jgi:hypothetical protein